MKLVINAARNTGGGGLQVALSFIRECISFSDNEYEVWINPNLQSVLGNTIFPSNFNFRVVPKLNFLQMGKYLSKLERKAMPDVVFSVFGPTYWRPQAPHLIGFAQGHYIYSESPFWRMISWKQRLFWWIKRQIHLGYFRRDADAIVCETLDATNRIRQILGSSKKYFTVSNTYGTHFRDKNKFVFGKDLPSFEEGIFSLLTVANFYPHKNIVIIRSVVDALLAKGITNVRFILTITHEEYCRVFGHDYSSYVFTVGTISPDSCPTLYDRCDAVFLPSLIECFSANYPEAMVMKKPILTSDLGFARSICGNAALYFNPISVDDIVDKIECLLGDVNLRQKLIQEGSQQMEEFPDAKTRARNYLRICGQLMK